MTPNKEKALFLAKRQLSELVYDAVNLEGIHYTLPEIQTLLDGVTVGGHKLSDQIITLNQAAAWRQLFKWVANDTFMLTKGIACQLHVIAAKEEALKWGCFREGGVTIAGTDYLPPDAKQLDKIWSQMLEEAEKITDIYDRAITVFLRMARAQFFYDVNKRMGRFMMNGILLSQGYPIINLPAKKQSEFNQLMLDFYPSGDTAPMITFMKDCIDRRVIEIMSE
ncbi:MAG: cell filamentation protein Fic [Gammaproteobacteria bacterium]|jgi:prophage maintenance system killer protein|nr:cell filamentation protein Fic [Gammaproteobacteria bacterium]